MEELLSLNWMAQGKLQERFEHALQQVLMNIADLGYPAKSKRKIQIVLKLTVSENRTNAELSGEVKLNLPTEGPAIAALIIGRSNGELWATERTTPLLPLEEPPGPSLLNVETDLKEFADGTLNARFEDAFSELLANAIDINTPAKALRKIVATVEIIPNASRTHAAVAIDMATAMAKPHQLETTLLIGEPGDAGPVKTSQLDLTGAAAVDERDAIAPTPSVQ